MRTAVVVGSGEEIRAQRLQVNTFQKTKMNTFQGCEGALRSSSIGSIEVAAVQSGMTAAVAQTACRPRC